jgi:integrase
MPLFRSFITSAGLSITRRPVLSFWRSEKSQGFSGNPSGRPLKAPKSKKGRRSVTLPAIAIEALREHQRHQQQRKELLGEAYDDERLICCLEDGSLWKPSAFTSSYFSFLARRNFPRVSFHNLRHSHVSQLLRAGISPKVISERLGHSKVGFTLHTYAHLLPGMQEEAASRIDSVLRAAMEKRAYRA